LGWPINIRARFFPSFLILLSLWIPTLLLLSIFETGNGMNRGAGEDEHSSSPMGYDVFGAVAGEPPRWRRRTGNL